MKFILVLCDGMADNPIDILGKKTPLEFAKTPNMDAIAPCSLIGTVQTVADGMTPGSDVANLGVLGYDATKCYTGRSPLEALSLGITLAPDEIAMRANLVTLSADEPFENKVMLDYGAGEISTAEAGELISALNARFANEKLRFYTGTSYRNCFIVKGATPDDDLTAPHDISGRQIGKYLPKGKLAPLLENIMRESFDVLSNHPVNQKRISQGKRPANAVWFWGEGTAPNIENFKQKYGKSGVMISAVDLLKGIGIASGMDVCEIDGATGTLNTDYYAKAQGAITALDGGADFCMVHVEAPDECGHQKDVFGKVKAIEQIDEKIIGTLLTHFANGTEPLRMLVMPDHPTPCEIGTHTKDAVPFMLYDTNAQRVFDAQCTAKTDDITFCERTAKERALHFQKPWDLTQKFFS